MASTRAGAAAISGCVECRCPSAPVGPACRPTVPPTQLPAPGVLGVGHYHGMVNQRLRSMLPSYRCVVKCVVNQLFVDCKIVSLKGAKGRGPSGELVGSFSAARI